MRTSTIQKALVLAGFVALALAPLVLDIYRTRLLLTFLGYGVALLGYNLIFSYIGLLSFGHALFVALGAYTVAFMTTRFEIYSMELALVIAILVGTAVAMGVGALCVRYVEVYFAMLTFAFGMLFYTALLKSYDLTGGDEGMPVDRPNVLGLDLGDLGHLDFLRGPYYYYALGV
ncbi:MAG: branched-chain amino acid ABC transporter permease, partial [Candidatus Methylomirabilia bacterium]